MMAFCTNCRSDKLAAGFVPRGNGRITRTHCADCEAFRKQAERERKAHGKVISVRVGIYNGKPNPKSAKRAAAILYQLMTAKP